MLEEISNCSLVGSISYLWKMWLKYMNLK